MSTKQRLGNSRYCAGFLAVAVFDVEVGDVVGEDGDFVGVDFVEVFVFEAVGGQVVDEARDEGAGAGCRVEDLDVIVG